MGAAFTKVEIQNARARFMSQTRHYSPQSSGSSGGHSGGGNSYVTVFGCLFHL
jgi:hypothetical protein